MSLSFAALSRFTPILGSSSAPATGAGVSQRLNADSAIFDSALERACASPSVKTTYQHGYRHLPGYGRIEIVTVRETTQGADGRPTTSTKELAVCPECGTISCSCLARVTLQTRLDEENAKGPKDKELPQPFALAPQVFQQLNLSSAAAKSQLPMRMMG